MRLTAATRRLTVPLLAAVAATALHTLPAAEAGGSAAEPHRGPGHGAGDVVTTVASGLDNPRGLAFAPDGTLYVAESGRGGPGPCLTGPEGDEVCYGATGAVTRVRNGRQERVLAGLASLAAADGSAATGPSDVDARHGLALTVGLGADPAARAALPEDARTGLGWLARRRGSEAVPFADVAGFEASANPDGVVPPDSNPNSVVMTRTGWYVADAGGNSLVHVDPVGRTSTVAVFPERPAPAPPFLGLPPGAEIPAQAVPTSVVQGPDGALYVGQLTGFPFPEGGAGVYRVVPGQEPTVVAGGFTNVVDLGFDAHGHLYVLEIDRDGILTPDFAGRLLRVGDDGSHEVVVDEGLFAPNGLALRGDAAYVSNCGTCAGEGSVLRIPLHHG